MSQRGQMDQRIRLQERTPGHDAAGQQLTTWSDVRSIWAYAKPVRGREFFAAAQAQSSVDVVFEVDWRQDVTPQMRVIWQGVTYDITATPPPVRIHDRREIYCSSGVGDAH